MLRVGAVASIICDSLIEVVVDKNLIVTTALLHDMGNIIKYDFSKVDLLDEKDKTRVNDLKLTQKKFINKYGDSPDEATLSVIKEITSDSSVVNLCKNSHWELADQFLHTDFWDRKIVLYSDIRVGPFGVFGLNDRFDDLENRRPGEKASLRVLRHQGIEIEKEIQRAVKINLQDINDQLIEKEVENLRNFTIL